MNKVIIITTLMLYSTLINAQKYEQIITKEIIKTDTFYDNYIVEDKYRWLENVNSEETKEWIKIQNKLTKKYLTKSSNKTNSFNAIDKYCYAEYRNPRKMGKYYFTYAFYNNSGVPALFYQSSLKFKPKILVDPNFISGKDKIMLKGYSVSKDSKLLAYQFSRNGSDWAEVKVISIRSGTHKKDHLRGLKFSNIAWLGDGFFYSTIAQDGEFGTTLGQKVFYHKIGTEQIKDEIIFKRDNNPSSFFSYFTTSDERFFVLKERNIRLDRINIFYIDFNSPQPQLKILITRSGTDINILDSHNGKFIATVSQNGNNSKIVEIDPTNILKQRTIVPEFLETILLQVIPFTDRIVAIYQANQHPIITVFDYSGTFLYKLELPVATSVGGFSGNSYDEEVLFNYSSYTIPPVVYKFNIKTFERKLTKQTSVTFSFENIEYKEVECLSKDSVLIPIILVYEKGLKLDGTNPTILKAYGGFGIVTQPSFDPGIVHFIKKGGVFAFANIRGGGDKGEEWAKEGRGDNKQNSFDDFISAAEFLIENNYTNKEKLAATGASNGGLVVSAAAIQRPDLFKAVVPVVAPLDMIRFENFTIGHLHNDEYGTVTDSVGFTNLYGYSPYHNVQKEINYPAMLVVTSENDDRVPPFHSYKFVAHLQSRSAQKNPILLKTEMKSGHYGASTLFSSIREIADIYGFIMNEIGK